MVYHLGCGRKKAAVESRDRRPGYQRQLYTHNNNAKIGLFLEFAKLER